MIENTSVAYLRIDRMVEDDDLGYEKMQNTLSQMFAQYEPTRLVIDLRRNIGGNAIPARTITRAILDHSAFSLKGGTLVLISQETLSASVVFAQELAIFSSVTLVGSPTGSDANQWGDNEYFRLPNSGLTVSVATAFYQTAGPYGKREALLPEYFIPNRAESYFDAQDDTLNFAIDHVPDLPVEDIFRAAEEGGSNPIDVLSESVLHPLRQFQDLERPLRMLSRSVIETNGLEVGLQVCNLLIRKHSDRSRSYMERASILESMGRTDKSIEDWQKAVSLLDQDRSLNTSLKRRLRRISLDEISRLNRSRGE